MRVRLPTTPAFSHLAPFNTYVGRHMEVTPLSLSGISNDIKTDTRDDIIDDIKNEPSLLIENKTLLFPILLPPPIPALIGYINPQVCPVTSPVMLPSSAIDPALFSLISVMIP